MVVLYRLFRYSLNDLREELVYESSDLIEAESASLDLSKENTDYPYYTYRLDVYKDGQWIEGSRFFSNGTEITRDIINIVLESRKDD